MSAPARKGDDGWWFPHPSTFVWSAGIPAEILEPLLRPPAPEGAADTAGHAPRSARGLDAEPSAP